MVKVEIIPPDITEEENERRWQELIRVITRIVQSWETEEE